MNEFADARSIAVLRTRLPYIDRRSLSDAWFSALHLAADETASRSRARVAAQCEGRTNAAKAPSSKRAVVGDGPMRARFAATERNRATGAPVNERRVRDETKLSRVAAAFGRARSYPALQTSLTIGPSGERVQLVLRREGPVLHVVALCAPKDVGLVRIALSRADALLRRSGEAVLASVRAFDEVAV